MISESCAIEHCKSEVRSAMIESFCGKACHLRSFVNKPLSLFHIAGVDCVHVWFIKVLCDRVPGHHCTVVCRIIILIRLFIPLPLLACSGVVLSVDVRLYVSVHSIKRTPVIFIARFIVCMPEKRFACTTKPRILSKDLLSHRTVFVICRILYHLDSFRRVHHSGVIANREPEILFCRCLVNRLRSIAIGFRIILIERYPPAL